MNEDVKSIIRFVTELGNKVEFIPPVVLDSVDEKTDDNMVVNCIELVDDELVINAHTKLLDVVNDECDIHIIHDVLRDLI